MVTVATIGKSVGGGQQRARDGSLYPLTIATPREAYLYLAAGPALPHADGELLSALRPIFSNGPLGHLISYECLFMEEL